MTARFCPRLLLALAAMALPIMASGQGASASSIYFCLNSNSRNLTPALYTTCVGNGNTQNASQVFSLTFGVSQVGTGATARAEVTDVTLLKAVDDTSVKLTKALFEGVAFSSLAIGIVVPNVQDPTAAPSNVTIILTHPRVTVLQDGGSAGGGAMTETVSFTFSEIQVIDNSVSPPATVTWPKP